MSAIALAVTRRANIREAAEVLGVSVATIYRWVSDGRLDHYRLGGRILFSPDHLDNALRNAERPATLTAA